MDMKEHPDIKEEEQYEEYKVTSEFWGWVIIIASSIGILGYGMVIMLLVRDAPRYWDFGQVDITPAESIYSTQEPPLNVNDVQQLTPLPEGVPMPPGSGPADSTPTRLLYRRPPGPLPARSVVERPNQ
jgi:hypothetical protein